MGLHPDAQKIVERTPPPTLEVLTSVRVAELRAASTLRAQERSFPTGFSGTTTEHHVGSAHRVHDAGSIDGADGPVRVREYRPSPQPTGPTVVYFHGGGFVVGEIDGGYDSIARHIAHGSDGVVISVDYRLAPEHPFPAAVEDAMAVVEWAANRAAESDPQPAGVVLAGDSAGGNLAALAAIAGRDRGLSVAGQILIYPILGDVDMTRNSYREYADGYLLTSTYMRWFLDQYLGTDRDSHNPAAFPIAASDLAGLPRALVITAEFDVLRDEGAAYVADLVAAGNRVDHHHVDGVPHGFLVYAGELEPARTTLDDIAAWLSRLR